jgi:myo-inositol-1-phosphate synthase
VGDVRIAIAGIGNCASSLVQGLAYYKDAAQEDVIGLMHTDLGGYTIRDVKVVAAFDVDRRKVGVDVAGAIFQKPNCTEVFCADVPPTGAVVKMGPVLDGVASHMRDYPPERTFVVADEEPCDVAEELRRSGAEILVNYVPVGSEEATRFYAGAALDAGAAFVNCVPAFIASDETWAGKFTQAGLPVVGDDIKAQVGATITHRVLARLFTDRGVKIDRTYQLNTGGNTDFLNMLEHARLASKKVSKTESVQSQLKEPLSWENIHIGPSDYVPFQNDNKVCFLRIEGREFGDVPVELELRLSVEDSPNSAGVAIDAIRCARLALDRKIAGPLISISSYTMKHPPVQYADSEARDRVEQFISGALER